MYSSINPVHTEYLAGNNSKLPFYANTYNYSLIDARRTCATKLYGYTLGDYGTIIDNNAYRYAEFWAGSGIQNKIYLEKRILEGLGSLY